MINQGSSNMVQGLNTQYAIAATDDVQRYPALQADNYQPSNAKQQINLCLSTESVSILPETVLVPLGLEPGTADFGESEVEIGILPTAVRWVLLAPPKMFATDKATKEIFRIQKGQKLKDLGRVTLSRLLLAAVVEGIVLCDDAGLPQIFTLNLKSSKTALVGSGRDADCGMARNNGNSTVFGLNKALCDHYKLKNTWLTHLVSVSLKAVPEKFKSSTSGDASWGIRFLLDGGAKPLSEDQQKVIFDLITTEDFKALAEDPFRLAAKQDDDRAVEADVVWSEETTSDEGIPF